MTRCRGDLFRDSFPSSFQPVDQSVGQSYQIDSAVSSRSRKSFGGSRHRRQIALRLFSRVAGLFGPYLFILPVLPSKLACERAISSPDSLEPPFLARYIRREGPWQNSFRYLPFLPFFSLKKGAARLILLSLLLSKEEEDSSDLRAVQKGPDKGKARKSIQAGGTENQGTARI